ncbi:copia protein [Tanacetum coccineum]
MKVKESLNVTFDETPRPPKTSPLEDDDLVKEEAIEVNKRRPLGNDLEVHSLMVLSMRRFTMAQPPGILDFAKPNHVYRLKKALYGLKQAPKAWYDRLKAFLIKHDYIMGMKQTALIISTTEAEYVSARKACQQALWMKQALVDYGIRLDDIPIMCDNKGAIDLSKNPVQHSRTKHIEIRHHFLRDNVQKGNISIEKVSSEDNIADILTKPLKREPFNYLRLGLGMMEQID